MRGASSATPPPSATRRPTNPKPPSATSSKRTNAFSTRAWRSVSSGIRFHPGGFPALFGVPASELLDLRVPLRDVVRRFRSLERLAAEAAPPDPLAGAVWSASDLGTIARSFGYGERQLRRRIVAATGHAPKRLMRIARMQRLLLDGRGESWARSAVEHGYYDEAHMANDVRDLVAVSLDRKSVV